MKIGLISDTHDQLDLTISMVARLLDEGVAYLIHAGDIGQGVADYLATLPIKCVAVYGNTDTALRDPGGNLILQKQPYYFKIGSTTFKLMHQPYFLTPDTDVVVFGHLHRFECQKAKALFLNPGEVCAREKPLSEGVSLDLKSFKLKYHTYDLINNTWSQKGINCGK
ncbi:MAG: YfcE family phosphodiesterase [Epsilonproteobacteria bacterium]|nr:YfcE family phosphodiesterase [Campylobacterota bacterium]NPA63786.1 metallophosphoesterase family protein [Campylobacterota bacterium]